MNPELIVHPVTTRDDFVKFLESLRRNLLEHPDEWRNVSLGDFLEAMSAWIDDMDGYYENNNKPVPITPTWSSIAEILIAAKIYE